MSGHSGSSPMQRMSGQPGLYKLTHAELSSLPQDSRSPSSSPSRDASKGLDYQRSQDSLRSPESYKMNRMSEAPPLPPSSTHPKHQRPWQDSLHTAGQALNFLVSSGTHSDVTFVVGRESKQFKVHRLILSMRSPVFEDLLLLNPMDRSGVVTLKDDSSQAFHWLLNHIYSDKKDLDSIDNALLVLGLADKYMIASAYDTAIRYLQTIVKRNNVLKIYHHLVHLFSDNDSLRALCRRIFTDNGNAVLISPALLDLSPEAMTQLLQEPLKVTSETVILKALVQWGQAQLKRQGQQLTPSNLRRQIEPFISEIRFLTMTSDEFVQNVVTSDVLVPEETVFVLKHLAKPSDENLSTSGSYLKINNSRISRSSPITKEQMHTCLCESSNKTWLKDSEYEFQFVTSDNIVLLGLKVQLHGGNENIQLEIRKEDPGGPTYASAEAVGNSVSFKNPVHLREGVAYIFNLKLKDPNTSIYGSRYSKQTYDTDGFLITLSSGIMLQAVVFI